MLKLNLKDSHTRGLSLPYIAINTCEGSSDPAVHADHADPAAPTTPAKSKFVNKTSLRIPLNQILIT